ncbi:hypothetical protein WJX73_003042 [Symbiochloris irregularis]|uniref:RING-type domain-containing protein n=1 Tax=Symbiochloris irregularis TaxID=706552 RepID=A0AAW1P9I9_9CHLO
MGNSLSCVSAPAGRQLLTAAAAGNATQVQNVLEDRPELASYTFFGNNFNVAHHAAAKGHLDVLKALVDVLSNNASDVMGGRGGSWKEEAINAITWSRYLKDVLNARTGQGETALILACSEGHADCVAFLLEHGADVFAVDRTQRRSAIHCAAAAGRTSVLRRLLDDATKVHTEDGLVCLKDVRVHDMSGQCRYMDSRAENGMTALHLAAFNGNLASVQCLLDAGASMMAMLQAHADALGTWGRAEGEQGAAARRGWEGDGRIDLRSVANTLRQLPYHVAWQRGFRQAAGVLNPTVAIDSALENVRELENGYGPQRLATLAAYALRINLLQWLAQYKNDREQERRLWHQREHVQKVIHGQRHKEVRKFHSEASAEEVLQRWAAQFQDEADSGHLAAPAGAAAARESDASSGITSVPAGLGPVHTLQSNLSNPRLSSLSQTPTMETVAEGLSERSRSTASQSTQSRNASGRISFSSANPQEQQDAEQPLPLAPADESAPEECTSCTPPHPTSASDEKMTEKQEPLPLIRSNNPEGLSNKARLSLTEADVAVQPSPFLSPFENMGPPSSSASSLRELGSEANEEAQNALPGKTRSVRFAHLNRASSQSLASTTEPERQPGPASMDVTGASGLLGLTRADSAADPSAVQSSGLWRMQTMPDPFRDDLMALAGPVEGIQLSRTRSEGAPIVPRSRLQFKTRSQQRELIVAGPSLSRPDDVSTASNVLTGSRSSGLRRTISSMTRWAGRASTDNHVRRPSVDGAANLWRAASIQGFEDMPDAEDPECGICLDEPHEVGIRGCKHRLCLPCAQKLCEVNKKPPLCPFCRCHIEAFLPLPVVHHGVVI